MKLKTYSKGQRVIVLFPEYILNQNSSMLQGEQISLVTTQGNHVAYVIPDLVGCEYKIWI